jgi:hypothetical protein
MMQRKPVGVPAMQLLHFVPIVYQECGAQQGR